MRRFFIAMIALGALALGAIWYLSAPRESRQVEVTIPALSAAAQRGQTAYGRFCAECHGDRIDGTEKGPPLMHPVYNPGHHGDAAFVAATRKGAKAHHWPFGDMKPVEGVSDTELAEIIRFVREVQKANGLF